MSFARVYRIKAARLHSVADRLELKGGCVIHSNIARDKAAHFSKMEAVATRWEQMAATPLGERPGGFPGDPFNARKRVKPDG